MSVKPAPGEAREELFVPVKRTAPKISSSGCVVASVLPELGARLDPLAVWTWSRGDTAARPVNSLADACAPLTVLGKATVMKSDGVRAMTL